MTIVTRFEPFERALAGTRGVVGNGLAQGVSVVDDIGPDDFCGQIIMKA